MPEDSTTMGAAAVFWMQRTITLRPRHRGLHSITAEVLAELPEVSQLKVGLLHLFLQHTSASLTVNEDADPDVARDLAAALDPLAPETGPYAHTVEGKDDMPAHIKTTLTGCSLSLPVAEGRLALGTWQGVFLCEHRNRGGSRRLVATLYGQTNRGE